MNDFLENLDKNEVKSIQFCDYLEVTSIYDDVYMFNVNWSSSEGLYLTLEGELPNEKICIKKIHLVDSTLIFFYLNGETRIPSYFVKSININDSRMKRRCGFGIEGELLKYNKEMALKYDLNLANVEVPIPHRVKKRDNKILI